MEVTGPGLSIRDLLARQQAALRQPHAIAPAQNAGSQNPAVEPLSREKIEAAPLPSRNTDKLRLQRAIDNARYVDLLEDVHSGQRVNRVIDDRAHDADQNHVRRVDYELLEDSQRALEAANRRYDGQKAIAEYERNLSLRVSDQRRFSQDLAAQRIFDQNAHEDSRHAAQARVDDQLDFAERFAIQRQFDLRQADGQQILDATPFPERPPEPLPFAPPPPGSIVDIEA